MTYSTFALSALMLAALAVLAPRVKRRLELSRAKHASQTGQSKMAKRVAGLLPGYANAAARFFGSAGAPEDFQRRRRAGFDGLVALYAERFPKSAALTAQASAGISDLQFTGSYRVPFQYSPYLRSRL